MRSPAVISGVVSSVWHFRESTVAGGQRNDVPLHEAVTELLEPPAPSFSWPSVPGNSSMNRQAALGVTVARSMSRSRPGPREGPERNAAQDTIH